MTFAAPKSWKVFQMVSQSDAKATQVVVGDPFKTYSIYRAGTSLGHLGMARVFFLFVLPAHVFFSFLLIFVDVGQNGFPNGVLFRPDGLQVAPLLDKVPTCSHSEVQERSRGAQVAFKLCPMMPKEIAEWRVL
jgi:hypothetical protein